MWIEQWLDLVGCEVTLEKRCFKSLSEWKSKIYGTNVKREAVPDCGASEGEGPFSEKSVCLWLAHEAWSCKKMSETKKRVCIYAAILTYTWDPFRKGAMTAFGAVCK